jgi:hypothetical protein
MANRLTSLIAMMILSAIFLIQFRFDMDAFSGDPGGIEGRKQAKPPGGGTTSSVHAKRCQKGKKLNASETLDCQINQDQSFCQVPTLIGAGLEKTDRVDLEFRCEGKKYNQFVDAMRKFSDDISVHGDSWGRREYGIPVNKTVLMMGNTDTQQIAHTLACQQLVLFSDGSIRNKITSVQAPLSVKKPAQRFTFANNSTLVLLSDEKLAKAKPGDFPKFIERETGIPPLQYDAIIFGLFHDCAADDTTCPDTTNSLFFATADIFPGPMLFVGMMSDVRTDQSFAIRDGIREYKSAGRRNLWFIHGRRHISKLKVEGATIKRNKTDADNTSKSGRYGHRCTGAEGGHSDLLAFDVTEFLYNGLFYT